MKDKKNSVITFRCADTTKAWLEEEAERRNWTVAKLTENIISNFVADKEENEKDRAKEIFNYIMESNCNSLIQLTKWAIDNDCATELSKSVPIWEAIMKERNA